MILASTEARSVLSSHHLDIAAATSHNPGMSPSEYLDHVEEVSLVH